MASGARPARPADRAVGAARAPSRSGGRRPRRGGRRGARGRGRAGARRGALRRGRGAGRARRSPDPRQPMRRHGRTDCSAPPTAYAASGEQSDREDRVRGGLIERTDPGPRCARRPCTGWPTSSEYERGTRLGEQALAEAGDDGALRADIHITIADMAHHQRGRYRRSARPLGGRRSSRRSGSARRPAPLAHGAAQRRVQALGGRRGRAAGSARARGRARAPGPRARARRHACARARHAVAEHG